jgi:rod shape determining protein RodA
MYTAGAKKRYIFFLILLGVLTIIVAVIPEWGIKFGNELTLLYRLFTDPRILQLLFATSIITLVLSIIGYYSYRDRILYWISYASSIFLGSLAFGSLARLVLQDYQISRLIIFLNPYIDTQDDGWNILQSLTAVGSGGFFGKGFLQGTQSHLRYLPKQSMSTDFIFSILSEEMGFIGGLLVFSLFIILLYRGLLISMTAKDKFSAYTASGIVGMLFFHVVINTGMTMGLMPITGIPLFFLSYGGSNLWTGLLSVGVLLNIHVRRYKYS